MELGEISLSTFQLGWSSPISVQSMGGQGGKEMVEGERMGS